MAKKAVETEIAPHDFTEQVCQEIEKDFGEGIIVGGSSLVQEKRQIIPISPAFDIISSGGVTEGSSIAFIGAPKCGKTTSALSLVANAQKPEYGGRRIFYGNIEGRITEMHLRGVKGLNLEPPYFNVIRSREGRILTSQEFLTIFEKILTTVPKCVLLIDSISSLTDQREISGGVGTETRGGGAKLFSQFLRNVANVLGVMKSNIIGITHLIANTSGYGSPVAEKCAAMWKYQRDFVYYCKGVEPWKAGEKQIGQKVKWLCQCSGLGPPGMSLQSFLRFGVGLDRLYETMNLGLAIKAISLAGAWLKFNFLQKYPELLPKGKTDFQAQGGEKAYQALLDNPLWVEALNKEIMAVAGDLAGSSSE